jgi:hypothetical protein
MNSQDIYNLQESYLAVYDDETRENLEFENWVNNLLDEGYDLSSYTWEGLYEEYIQTEAYNLYDVILSHLLDEGYAETVENAEAIMVNMSEDWRESICEEEKPRPVDKMAKQAERKAFYHNLDYEPWSYYTNTNRQLRKMSEVGGEKVKKAAQRGRELANDVDNRLHRKYQPPSIHW